MTEFHLALDIEFGTEPPNADTDGEFEAFLDQVLAELEELGHEVSLAARFTERRAEFAVTIEADDYVAAVIRLLVDVRTALHAVRCHTPAWPKFAPLTNTLRQLQDA